VRDAEFSSMKKVASLLIVLFVAIAWMLVGTAKRA
jgi:hypothetical protein